MKPKVELPVEPAREEPQKEEPPFIIEPVVEPEPAQVPVEEIEEPKSVVSRMKDWLNRQLNMLAQDEI